MQTISPCELEGCPVAVLATVVLMSYTKLLQTTVGALQFKTLMYHGSSQSFYSDGLLFDDNITYSKGSTHIWHLFPLLSYPPLHLPPPVWLSSPGLFRQEGLYLDQQVQANTGSQESVLAWVHAVDTRRRVFLGSILIADATNLL